LDELNVGDNYKEKQGKENSQDNLSDISDSEIN